MKTDGHISLVASSMSFSDLPAAQLDIAAHFHRQERQDCQG